jgi:hypothetical protein
MLAERIPTKKYIRYILTTPINNGATIRENNKIILFVKTEATPFTSLHNYVTIQLLNLNITPYKTPHLTPPSEDDSESSLQRK